jgi:hypothetical protein
VHVALVCDRGHVISNIDEIEMVDGPGALPPVPA